MKLLAIFTLFFFFAPVMKPAKMLANFAVIPIMNAFFFTLNPVSYPEAMAGCAQKGMTLAEFSKTDIGAALGPPESQAWIGTWDGLVCDAVPSSTGAIKAITVKFIANPMKIKSKQRNSLNSAFPSCEDSAMSLPYICQPFLF